MKGGGGGCFDNLVVVSVCLCLFCMFACSVVKDIDALSYAVVHLVIDMGRYYETNKQQSSRHKKCNLL